MIGPGVKIAGAEPDRLLSAPQVVLQLVGACQDLSGDPTDLLGIVLQDSGLCARILAAAAKACPEDFDSAAPLSSALVGLGRPAIRSLALQAAKTLIDTPLEPRQTQFLHKVWFYSQVAGSLCRSFAEAVNSPAVEEAQLTGLMLNIGMLALFSSNPRTYAEQIGCALGSPQVRGKEQSYFATDHCLVGTAMVETWHIDSFLAEAIRFIYLEPLDCREGALLVRIARLAFALCKTPLELPVGSDRLAAQLLDLDRRGLESAFRNAADRYRLLASFDKSPNECHQGLERNRRRLTSLVFSLAEQEGIRAHLATSAERTNMIAAARALYLRVSPAREVIFFVAGSSGEHFIGKPAPGQSRRIAELATSIDGANLLAEALRSANPRHSFENGNSSLSVFDHQLLGLCGSAGFAVLPLRSGQQRLGGVVLGLDAAKDIEELNNPGCYQLGWAVAASLAAQPAPANFTAPPLAGAPVRKITHEIRTPLAIINNYMSALGQLLEGNENAGIIGEVEKEVRRIDEILAYYADSGAPVGDERQGPPQTPDALVSSVLDSLAATHFVPKQLEVVTDFAPNIAPLPVSPVAVRQILVNLLKNAAEALPDQGQITLATRECLSSTGERQVVISVQDNGPGIGEAVLERLFSPITSTKGEGHAGLGLHIIKGLADDIGARILCQSLSGYGTRFELTIPRPIGP